MITKGKATLLAVRAIGVVYGNTTWWAVFFITLGISIALIALCAWLISVSGWWWILGILVGMGMSIAAVLLTVFKILLHHINPSQTKEQKIAVKEFTEKLRFVQELTQTPKFIILFRVIRSVAAPSSEKYLETIFASRKLKNDFERIVSLF